MKKIISVLCAVVLVLSCMAGCGGDNSSSATTESAAGSEAASVASEAETSASVGSAELSGKLSIWSWGADSEAQARKDAVQVFIDEHPELEIEHVVLPTADSVWDQKSAAAFAAGNAGDVMQMSPDYYGLMTDYYEDLNPYVEKEGVDLDEVISGGMMNGYYDPDGKLEALPLLANCFVFAYNKDMFDAMGVEYPTEDWTWEDLVEMAPKFISGSGATKTFCLVNHWSTKSWAMYAEGGTPYSDDLKTSYMDSEEIAAGIDLFKGLIDMGGMPDDTASESLPAEQLFVSGQAAMYPLGGFEANTIIEEVADSFSIGYVSPPKDPNGKAINLQYATGYAMNVASQNKDAAWQFLKEVAYENDDMAKETCKAGMTSNKAVLDSYYSTLEFGETSSSKLSTELYIKCMPDAILNPWGGALATAGDQYTNMWQAATMNDMTAKEAQEQYAPLIASAFSELKFNKA